MFHAILWCQLKRLQNSRNITHFYFYSKLILRANIIHPVDFLQATGGLAFLLINFAQNKYDPVMEKQSKSQCTILSWVFALCILCTFSSRKLAVRVAPLCFCTLCRCIKYLDIFCFYCASCFCPVNFCVDWFRNLVFWIVTDNTLQL